MDIRHLPWGAIFVLLVKFLKVFGVIPGALAALAVKKLYQKQRQSKAMAGWPSTEANIQSGQAHHEGARIYWAEITYSYYVGEYRAGKYIRHFRKEDEADDFIRQIKDKRIQVHYDAAEPDKSVLLDRDIEMIVLLAPQFR